ncbi:hypothetical protein ANN_25441 [Periplaneta americana]|uniref:Ionotropic receptor n=1 Tax=Periplaneta americana TaxID=6978 RepID=A0ABQ8S1H7_PERAM|nr:hypothetical protein ANN_25441 [Periplaneta americana]
MLSRAKWLLLLDNSNQLEDFFANVNIPFDCEFLVAQPQGDGSAVLTEVYRISPTMPLRAEYFGNWTSRDGLACTTAALYDRRRNLKGLHLKAGIIHAGFTKITRNSNGTAVDVGALFGDLWHVVEEHLQFKSEYHEPPDNAFGILLDNGSWNGLMGLTISGEVEVGVAGVMYTIPRMNAVAFLNPIAKERNYVYIKRSGARNILWTSFFKPFNVDIWIVVIVCAVTVSACSLMLDITNCSEIFAYRKNVVRYVDNLFHSASIFCLQGNMELRPYISAYIIHLTTYVTAAIVVISYSASLLSYIMTKTYRLPFTDFQEFLNDGSYKLGVMANSAYIPFFKNSTDLVMRQVYQRHIAPYESTLPQRFSDAMEMLCKGHNFASLFPEAFPISMLKRQNCTMEKVPNAFVRPIGSMITPKNSPYREILKHTISSLYWGGVF